MKSPSTGSKLEKPAQKLSNETLLSLLKMATWEDVEESLNAFRKINGKEPNKILVPMQFVRGIVLEFSNQVTKMTPKSERVALEKDNKPQRS